MLDGGFLFVLQLGLAEDYVVEREPAGAAHEENAEQEEHERRKLEGLPTKVGAGLPRDMSGRKAPPTIN
jgi:hypothetical protein